MLVGELDYCDPKLLKGVWVVTTTPGRSALNRNVGDGARLLGYVVVVTSLLDRLMHHGHLLKFWGQERALKEAAQRAKKGGPLATKDPLRQLGWAGLPRRHHAQAGKTVRKTLTRPYKVVYQLHSSRPCQVGILKMVTGGGVREHLKVSIGIGLTWSCVFILYYGLTHATLDGRAFVFPVFKPTNMLVLISAPMAQSAFYALARKNSWLLNIFLAISVLCCVVGWLSLNNDDGFRGYRFTYWHQGDLLCVHGCNDTWLFSGIVVVQGCILILSLSASERLWGSWRGVVWLLLVALLLWLLFTSCAIWLSM